MDIFNLKSASLTGSNVRAVTTPLAPPPGTRPLPAGGAPGGASVLGADTTKVSGGGGASAATPCSCGLTTSCDGSHLKLATLAGGATSPQILLKLINQVSDSREL